MSRRILLVLLIGVATPAFVSIQSLVDVRHSLLDARASEVKHLDEAAWALVAGFHDEAARGLISEDVAKEAAKNAIRRMRYDRANYFFVWDLAGAGVAHGGNQSLEGRNFIRGPDAAARPGVSDMVRKLVGVARDRGEGFAHYRIPRAGQDTPLDKISYSKLFAPWGWAIGTGAYVTDIDAVFWSDVRVNLLVAAGLILLATLVCFALGRDLSRSLAALTDVVSALSAGDLDAPIACVARRDEIGVLARAMLKFRRDALEARRQDARLQQTRMRLEAAMSTIVQGLCVHDREGRIEIFNQRFCAILGLEPDAVRPGMSLRELLTASFAAGNYPGRALEDVILERQNLVDRGEPATLLIELAHDRLVSIVQRPMPNGGWVATYEDVTDRRAADARITYLARHDALTGLPNRLVLNERIDAALTDAGRGAGSALLCLDLDGFKRVNDTFGHPVGDGLLVAVAERLSACVREGDTVARVGGDEFVIVQVGVTRPEDAKLLAERVIQATRPPFTIDGHHVTVGVTIGLALMPDDGQTHTRILKNADTALYRAKAEERGTFCFFEAEMDARLQLRRQLELDLQAALVREEFELYYQPLVDPAREEAVGFEALLRWRHPERGMVAPSEFIAVAEEIGLIVPLGEWVIGRACTEAATWPGSIKVAVNLSPYQFRSNNLVPTVARALRASGLSGDRLELEVTETLMLEENDTTLATLHALRALGTRIAIDDFGTGYSSLSYLLRSFPFDKIKIDQSFVRDLSRRMDAIHIIRAITGLCASLGMTTTAEGVETQEQLATVLAEGCTEVQGFLFSPPRPASEAPAMLEQVRRRRGATSARVTAPDVELIDG